MTDEIAEGERELLEHARKAYENAHAPYTKRAFGAAVRSGDGRIFSGCTVETLAFTGSFCAEQVAIGNAVANGAKELVQIALYPAEFPCGMCRQVMLEFNESFKLVIEVSGKLRQISMVELLPHCFGPQKAKEFGGATV